MGDIVVEGIRLSVSYGKHRAVSDMSFRVDADDGVVGMFGPNGAGKPRCSRRSVAILGDMTVR